MSDAPAYWMRPITEEERQPHGCLNCEAAGVINITFPPDGLIAVGFGAAQVTKNGQIILDGEAGWEDGKDVTGADAEAEAVKDPDHDWRIEIHGPMSGRVYQRQGAANWVLVDQDEGFA